ncbi:NUDIX hydrolase [Hirschia baltica]|uniref:NrtR DNA-binding winged helix domain-containing protein n=1 Tax=Hirschia baltica (strain ATCC 49814 / DSM 5838 / IFAM 1418) TaxID=582402 RepID=C6XRJ7_HIRBI|nr:conserved hypothetical protein [Hirschia baltica ATCC 49814]
MVGLSAVIVAANSKAPYALVTRHSEGRSGLPFGAFDPANHRTMEQGLRDWVHTQTGFEPGYVEQLYTFADHGRELPKADMANAPDNARIISVGYLGLTPERTEIDGAFNAVWRDWYRYFPWEDHRDRIPDILEAEIKPALMDWAGDSISRKERAKLAFGFDDAPWIEERVLERYELLYEAGLAAESIRDGRSCASKPISDQSMVSDHRRILATAISRLRGKIKYRPVIFELITDKFTLLELQQTVESLLGQSLHKQNFRRSIEKSELVEGLGEYATTTGGRPAELFRCRKETLRKTIASGIATPHQRRDT